MDLFGISSAFTPSAAPQDHGPLLGHRICEYLVQCLRERTLFHSITQYLLPFTALMAF